ncbi:hypothetical protein RHGRI_001838 [Rhododendron griersonianum]|uniref:Myb-like domain-containing protein n=1 Tax=Rhododendron griersonianum TaxID=479676 RepID=A0AAV6LMP3_9ERIC|nr:hypothetical protein RHGRI_001838 [Rhododendron griersonianum]
MGRAPCCAKVGLHRGPWTAREDSLLSKYIQVHGEGNWRSLPKKAGDVDRVGFLIGDDQDPDMVNGSDLECQSGVPLSDHNTTEKLYEDYLQLLIRTEGLDLVQLDSFAESLLI